mgnify:CR=1 FL=1
MSNTFTIDGNIASSGSSTFDGDQVITGSLLISGSNTSGLEIRGPIQVHHSGSPAARFSANSDTAEEVLIYDSKIIIEDSGYEMVKLSGNLYGSRAGVLDLRRWSTNSGAVITSQPTHTSYIQSSLLIGKDGTVNSTHPYKLDVDGDIKLGNGTDDSIEILGPVTASTDISSSATSTASFGHYLGDGSQLTNLPAGSTPTLQQVTTAGNITDQGLIVSGSTIFKPNTSVAASIEFSAQAYSGFYSPTITLKNSSDQKTVHIGHSANDGLFELYNSTEKKVVSIQENFQAFSPPGGLTSGYGTYFGVTSSISPSIASPDSYVKIAHDGYSGVPYSILQLNKKGNIAGYGSVSLYGIMSATSTSAPSLNITSNNGTYVANFGGPGFTNASSKQNNYLKYGLQIGGDFTGTNASMPLTDGSLIMSGSTGAFSLKSVSSEAEIKTNGGDTTLTLGTTSSFDHIEATSFKGDGSQLTNLPAASAGSTSGRVVFTTTGGALTTDSGFDYNSADDILSAPTASFAHLIVSQVISSSVINTSGSNIFGDESTDTQTLNGSVILNNISTDNSQTTALFIDTSPGGGSNTIKKRTLQANAFTSTTIGTTTNALTVSTGLNLNSGTTFNGSTAKTISVDVSDFMTNGSNNRIVTATGTDAMNAEANLTFDGSSLGVGAATSPSYELDVFGSIAVQGVAFAAWNSDIIKLGDFDGNGAKLALYDDSSAELVRLDGGRVGIGTTSPSAKLDVNGNISASGFIKSDNSLRIGDEGDNGFLFISGSDSNNDDRNSQIKFQRSLEFRSHGGSTDEILTLQYLGNVGIGKADAAEKLEVVGNISASGAIVGDTLNLKSSTLATGIQFNNGTSGQLDLVQSDGSSLNKFYIKADEVETPGLLNAKGDVQLGNDSTNLSDTITVIGHITSSGNISSSGNIIGNSFVKGGGTSAQFLKADGSVDSSTYLTSAVTSVTGTAPVVSSGGTTPAISMAAASTNTNGYLTSTNWNTFNGKTTVVANPSVGIYDTLQRITIGSTGFNIPGGTVLSVTGTAPVVSSGGTSPAISINAATNSAAGSMSAIDKGKIDAITVTSGVNLNTMNSSISSNTTAISGKAADGANSDITSLSGLTTALSVAQGGTGANNTGAFLMAANNLSEVDDPGEARSNLELGSMATQANTNVNIDGGSITGITDLAVADGGTGASNASTARSNLGAAASGANTDITSIINDNLKVGQSVEETTENYIDFSSDKIVLTQGLNLVVHGGADFRPGANNSMNLGTSAYMWADAYSRQFISDASTISTPAFVIDKDSPTTGFYSSGNNQIGITIGGSQIGYFNANGIQLNAGIGESNIGGHLQVHCLGVGTGASTTQGEIRAAGDVVANYSSDKRLKENIKPISGALDKLLQISGVTFDWIEKEEIHSHKGHDVGVIAQEVEEVLPEVVVTRDNGYKAVNYEKIVPLLIESIKDLKAEIDELKKSK